MKDFWIQNQAWLLPLIGMAGANIITPMVRKIPDKTLWQRILRAALSGVAKEFSNETPNSNTTTSSS